MSAERVEERAYEQLKRLHGRPINKEMGGKVAIGQARVLCRILDIPYSNITGEREETVEGHPDLDLGTTRCVDLSGVLEECEAFHG